MTTAINAFDDFVDDCFINEDPLCNKTTEDSLEIIASQIISELVSEDARAQKTA